MKRLIFVSTRIALFGFLFSETVLFAQVAEDDLAFPEIFSDPISLYADALGQFSRPISSSVPEAQSFFNQGFQLMYAFAKVEATRSFREAQKYDPNCAICYWGEAWTWGSYLNGAMRIDEAPHAYSAMQNALKRLNHASPKEQAFIKAMAVRYVEDFDPEKRLVQDEAYAEEMKKLAELYPNDLDAATLYAEALFIMEPRRGYRDIEDPDVQRIHAILEDILATDIKHPGACHLYIHATESTVEPGKAEPCAEYLGNAIPGASHINHMPSHTWNEIGRWGDSVRANLQAWHSDQKAATGQGVAIYPSHNLHMLLFSASNDGQGAIAIRAGKDYTKITGDSLYETLTMLRFGRFDEILGVPAPAKGDFTLGVWDFARGYAHLRGGESDFAQLYLERVRARAESSEARFRWHSVSDLLNIVAGILEGEIYRQNRDFSEAIDAFERAVELEDALNYDEPESLPFDSRHWLGALFLEIERYSDAEQVYREELKDHPHNGWSLFGLLKALEAQGKNSSEVEVSFKDSWARADTWIQSSRF